VNSWFALRKLRPTNEIETHLPALAGIGERSRVCERSRRPRLRAMTNRDRLAELLGRTAEAHHRAFAATDGADPDWPSWYATYLLQNGLEHLVEVDTLSVPGLTRLLTEADRRHRAESDGTSWELFYAKLLLARAHRSE